MEEVERQLQAQREEIERLRDALIEQSRVTNELRTLIERTERTATPSSIKETPYKINGVVITDKLYKLLKKINITHLLRASVILSFIVSVVLGYLFVWDRGLYMDDYLIKSLGQDFDTGTWHLSFDPLFPYVRVLGQLLIQNLVHAIPEHEFLVRLLMASVHAGSAITIGLIIFKLTESEIAGVLATWLYLMPFVGIEVLLWFVQIQHMIATFLFLIALYLAVKAIKKSTNYSRDIIFAGLLMALGLHFSELPIPAVVFPPFLALAALVSSSERKRWRHCILVSILLVALGVAIGFLHYEFFTGRYTQEGYRGEVEYGLPSILAKYRVFLEAIYWRTLHSGWGRQLIKEAVALGFKVIVSSPLSFSLLLLLTISSLFWVSKVPLPYGNRRTYIAKAIAIIIIGIVWMFAALVPGTLLSKQTLEERMMYFAFAGFALINVGVIWGAIIVLQEHSSLLRRIILAMPASIMILSTIISSLDYTTPNSALPSEFIAH